MDTVGYVILSYYKIDSPGSKCLLVSSWHFFPSPIADVYSDVPYALEYTTPFFVKSTCNFLEPIYFLPFEHTN